MDLRQLKKEVCDANIELVDRGLVIYTWGNVSAVDREKNLVVIKPKGIEYSDLTEDDMSVVTLDGQHLEGLLPSVDLEIHLEIYKNFPQVGGIAHTHSTWATAWCQAGVGIPVLGTTHADHFYGEIPCTRQMTEAEVEQDYERNVGKVICSLFKGRDLLEMGAVLTPGHGPFTWGKDAAGAVEHSVILEELAKMAKLSLDIRLAMEQAGGKQEQLPGYMLKKHYTRKYGADSYFYQEKPPKG